MSDKVIHVLLVEDDPVNQIAVKGLLTSAGYTVNVAKNGTEALNFLIANDAIYDVVIMDIGLPNINGMDVTRQLRQSQALLKNISIIALTGHVTPKDQEACVNSGMNRFLGKPTTKDILKNEIENLLKFE